MSTPALNLTSPPPVSAWAPLGHARYRWFWLASFGTYIGIWMQNVGAGWLMATLTSSPFFIAAVQFATSLPVFLLSLPAGVVADQGNRRSLILWTHSWTLVVALALTLASFFGLVGPWSLLIGTGMLGAGIAFAGPAVQSVVADLVPRAQLTQAIALGGIAYNTARSVGPALAGLILAVFSPAWVFLASASCVLGMMLVVLAMNMPAQVVQGPPERMLSGMRAGLRYARHAPDVYACLVRMTCFGVCASAIWALLPLLATQAPGHAAGGFGFLVGAIGAGAVSSAFVASRLQHRVRANDLIFWASLLYAGAMLAAPFLHSLPALAAAMVLCGIGWGLTLNTGFAAMQTVLPNWVRARCVAIYTLLIQGGMAVGSLSWGAIAEWGGIQASLIAAAFTLAALAFYTRMRFPLRSGSEAQVTPMPSWIECTVAVDPDPEEGPISIEIEYRIDLAQHAAFVAASRDVGRNRRKAGAMLWRLYRDLEDPSCYRERFIVDSWAEYIRSRARGTQADREKESALRAYHVSAQPIRVSHSVAER